MKKSINDINWDRKPKNINGYILASHTPNGRFPWAASKISLLASPEVKKTGKWVQVTSALSEVYPKMLANANILDHLLSNTQLIPKNWERKTIFFAGTRYWIESDGMDYEMIRTLIKGREGWVSKDRCVLASFTHRDYLAVINE